MSRRHTALVWTARVAWVLVAVVGGAAIEAAAAGRSDGVRWTIAIAGWTVWAIVGAALLIPSVATLTVARAGAPLALLAALAAALGGAPAVETATLAVASFVTVVATFTPELGRRWVQASAYGDEDRFPLRPPLAVGVAAVGTWVVWASCAFAAPWLLAGGNVAIGVLVAAVAIAGLLLLGPRWHRLSRRWLVLVPAGLVVHDPVVLADTVMLRRDQLRSIGLARADTEAADLTGPASGYALEVATTEPVTAVFAFTPSDPNGRAIHMTAFLVCPSRPGDALAHAATRGLPVD